MDDSHSEKVLEAIKDALIGAGIETERNIDVPVKVPADGMVILRDGDPGEPERLCGGFETSYYYHAIELELLAQAALDDARDKKYDALVRRVRTALYADKTFGGLIFGFETSKPEPQIITIEGGVSIKAAVLVITAEYQTDNPLE